MGSTLNPQGSTLNPQGSTGAGVGLDAVHLRTHSTRTTGNARGRFHPAAPTRVRRPLPLAGLTVRDGPSNDVATHRSLLTLPRRLCLSSSPASLHLAWPLGYQLSAVSYQLSASSFQPSAFTIPYSEFRIQKR